MERNMSIGKPNQAVYFDMLQIHLVSYIYCLVYEKTSAYIEKKPIYTRLLAMCFSDCLLYCLMARY